MDNLNCILVIICNILYYMGNMITLKMVTITMSQNVIDVSMP